MDWAGRRKFVYAAGVFAFIACVGLTTWYFFIYVPPSCADGKQNQSELGIDCEGPCSRMCTPPRVDALWSRSVKVADGVYHVVSLVKNPAPQGRGMGLQYQVSLFDEKNILVATREGTLDLEPGETRTVFESSVITSNRIPVRSLMKITGGTWDKASALENPIRIVEQGTPDPVSRVLTATIENTTAAPIRGVVVDALLYDADDVLVTASETKVATLAARERKEVSFTWGIPFERPVVRTDIQIRYSHEPRP